MKKELAKQYQPAEMEDRLYQEWEARRYFHAEVDQSKEPFTIVIPPPNITGKLHMGHALDNTMQDILIRYHRMKGQPTLWQPGTDHAAIATEVKIVNKMYQEEKVRKEDIGREAFMEKAWAWKEEYGGRIVGQLKKLGASCDWERERFTLDEGCSQAVGEVFERYYQQGYIYQGNRIINWCPTCQTSISEAEVEHEEQAGHFWHIRYPVVDSSQPAVATGDYVEIATTRPETMLGDTAVAVHPDDERYQKLIGKTVLLPLVNRPIPVIADRYVDPAFGTGVVKITPAHDPNDFEVGKRHDLPEINIMTDDGQINQEGGVYQGLDRYTARKQIVADLQAGGFLVKVKDHVHNVGFHDRCHTVIEPLIKTQWFVKMEELAKPAIEALKSGRLTFVPERYGKIYLNWLENIRDWCISRQLWWGHRIPAYYCQECGQITVNKDGASHCQACGSTNLKQDEDSLDTWFSSALWPFSTLGWPEKTEELAYFFPTDVLVTGYDIIFFWVIRMVFSSIELMGELPFKTVLIHGLIRDEQGRKMSKSLNNGIDPLEVIEQYGADALRFTLVTGNAPGNDLRYSQQRVEASRNFANKLWNASRFILMNLPEDTLPQPALTDLQAEDRWILSKINQLTKAVTDNLDAFDLGLAASKLHDFIWEEFCDWYIEMVKSRLYGEQQKAKQTALWTLQTVLLQSIRLLHPYMPFITEEIYQQFAPEATIMLADWPVYQPDWFFAEEEQRIELMKEAVRGVRNLRAELNVPPKKRIKAILVSPNDKTRQQFADSQQFFKDLAGANQLMIQADKQGVADDAMTVILPTATIYLPLADLIDIAKERERLAKERERLVSEIKRVTGKLANQGFVNQAPPAVVEAERVKQADYEAMLKRVEQRLAGLATI